MNLRKTNCYKANATFVNRFHQNGVPVFILLFFLLWSFMLRQTFFRPFFYGAKMLPRYLHHKDTNANFFERAEMIVFVRIFVFFDGTYTLEKPKQYNVADISKISQENAMVYLL